MYVVTSGVFSSQNGWRQTTERICSAEILAIGSVAIGTEKFPESTCIELYTMKTKYQRIIFKIIRFITVLASSSVNTVQAAALEGEQWMTESMEYL
jgi:hypothetical protein